MTAGRPGPGDPASPRPPRPRRRGPRKVTVGLAVLIAIAALVAGMVAGYATRGDDPPPPLQTIEREVRVVTVTPGR